MTDFYEDAVEYILQKHPDAKKIVEVGIGKNNFVLKGLKKKSPAEIIATDLQPENGILRDDLFEPKLEIFKGSDMIYTIRPPPEVIPYIQSLVKKVKANLLIFPLTTDSCYKPRSMKLINHKKAIIWEENNLER